MAMTKRAFDKMWVYGHAGLFVLCENYDETWKEVEKGNYYATVEGKLLCNRASL